MLSTKHKKAEMDVLIKIVSWALFFGIMILSVNYLLKKFGVFI